jgi:hypothetical protein
MMRALTTLLAVGLLLWASPLSTAAVTGDAPQVQAAEPPETTALGLTTAPRDGECLFAPNDPANSGIKTGYRDGVAGATVLSVMYVPCLALARAQAGGVRWLPEWTTFEFNRFAIDEDQSAAPTATVAQLCRDARTGHPAPKAPTLSAMVELGHAALDRARTVVHFGVIGEDPGVCYLASLTADRSPEGSDARLLTVTAFMLSGRQWIYQSLRRHSPSATLAESQFETARTAARSFLDNAR